ncbi:C-C chemokine receptor type 6-like [Coregonus clupeaformis]|uniref:C-C chemokine receptor type 6-like n=1 Tax=Coregonus clupeaformis TaxID=59861 RepID=UPI001E1C7948|nr:C-C chemokine receptor type 6-like [Coregonus clupeaformis]
MDYTDNGEATVNTTVAYEYDYDVVEPCYMEKNDRVERVVRLYIHSVICILGLLGNILVIVTYAFYKKAKSMTDVYLLNVAIADMLFVVALPLIIYNEQSGWAMGTVACKVLRGAYSVNLYSGMLLLACISTDRYIAIVQARRSFRLRSLIYSRIICAAVWSLALLLSIPTFVYYESYMPAHSNIGSYYGNYDYNNVTTPDDLENAIFSESEEDYVVCKFRFPDNATARQMKVLVPSTQMAVGFFLPLLVMGFCYTSIIVTLLHAKNFQRHKAVRVVLAVVVVFIACHLPYNTALLYDTVNKFKTQKCMHVDSTEVAKTVTETVAYLHCCLNPVLYAFIGVKFRNHFRKIVEDVWCMGKRVMNPRRFSRVTSEMYVSTVRKSVDGSSTDNSSFTM